MSFFITNYALLCLSWRLYLAGYRLSELLLAVYLVSRADSVKYERIKFGEALQPSGITSYKKWK